MKHLLVVKLARAALGAALLALGWASHVSAAPCLTNGTDAVGNPVFGATVNTFIGLGIDPNTTCIENSVWTDPSGFNLGTYVGGAEGYGTGVDNTVLGSYNSAGSAAANANSRDFAWVQDTSPNANYNGIVGAAPHNGIIWDLGGQANQAVIFVFVDHGPVPGEVLENTAWLSNDPLASDDGWTQANLVHVYAGGWSDDPNISDGFAVVYQLPAAQTFRYVSVTWGGPGAITRDGDNEIDAVGGLTITGGGLQCGQPGQPECEIPEPVTSSMFGLGIAYLGLISGGAFFRRRKFL